MLVTLNEGVMKIQWVRDPTVASGFDALTGVPGERHEVLRSHKSYMTV